MALLKSVQVAGFTPLLNADGANDLVPMFGDFTVPAGLAVNDVVEMTGFPAGYVPVDLIVDHEDFGTTFTADFGLVSGNYGSSDQSRTCGNEFLTAADLAAGPGLKRAANSGASRIAPVKGSSHVQQVSGDRGIGFVVKSAAGLTVGAKIRVTVLYRPQIDAK